MAMNQPTGRPTIPAASGYSPEQLAMLQQQMAGQMQQQPPADPLQLTTQLYVHIAQRALKDDLNVDIATASLKTLADAMTQLGTDPQANLQLEAQKAQQEMQTKRELAQLDMQLKMAAAQLDMQIKREQAGLQLQQKQQEAQVNAASKAQDLQLKQQEHLQKMSAQSEMAQAKVEQARQAKTESVSKN